MPPNAPVIKQQEHMKDAWVSFLNKDEMKKVAARICKVQSLYLSHHTWREGIMAKLEENGYAYLQSALDHSLEKILHDEITDFISNPTKE